MQHSTAQRKTAILQQHLPSHTHTITPPPSHPITPPIHPHSSKATHRTLAPGASSSLILLAQTFPSSTVGACKSSLPSTAMLEGKGKVASGGNRACEDKCSWVIGCHGNSGHSKLTVRTVHVAYPSQQTLHCCEFSAALCLSHRAALCSHHYTLCLCGAVVWEGRGTRRRAGRVVRS